MKGLAFRRRESEVNETHVGFAHHGSEKILQAMQMRFPKRFLKLCPPIKLDVGKESFCVCGQLKQDRFADHLRLQAQARKEWTPCTMRRLGAPTPNTWQGFYLNQLSL